MPEFDRERIEQRVEKACNNRDSTYPASPYRTAISDVQDCLAEIDRLQARLTDEEAEATHGREVNNVFARQLERLRWDNERLQAQLLETCKARDVYRVQRDEAEQRGYQRGLEVAQNICLQLSGHFDREVAVGAEACLKNVQRLLVEEGFWPVTKEEERQWSH